MNVAIKADEAPLKAWIRALEGTAPLLKGDVATLADRLDGLASAFESNPALISEDEVVTYRELFRRSNQFSRWALDCGLHAGEIVCLLMHNCPDYVAAWLGITRVGGIVALINTNLAAAALRHAITVASPAQIIVGADLAAAVDAIRSELPPETPIWTYAPAEGDENSGRMLDRERYCGRALDAAERRTVKLQSTALYIYTSGTTGLPKAVNVGHYRLLEWSFWFAGMMDTGPSDRLYNCLPMYHSTGGVVGIGAMLVTGGAVVIRRRFSASRFWDDIVEQHCTLFLYIGELCRYLLGAPHQPRETGHRLRLCFGNGLRGDIWESFKNRFQIPRIIEFYAATEGNVALYNCEGRPGAIGRIPPFLAHRFPVTLVRCEPESGEPVRGEDGRCIRCAADEVGEAVGKIVAGEGAGTRLFEGYTDSQASERKILRNAFAIGDAWFRTGDLMRRDQAGFFYFIDRLGDTFRWKGENVSTTQVAEVISACRGVADSVVYGVEVPGAEGRAGMAAVVAETDFSLADLHARLRELLPDYARILFLRICADLAMTGTFKPVKARLIEEGFMPNAAGDALYFNDPQSHAFVPIDPALRDRILAGQLRF